MSPASKPRISIVRASDEHPWACARAHLQGEELMAAAVAQLCRQGCWMSLTPAGGGEFILQVKSDRRQALEQAIVAAESLSERPKPCSI